MAKNGPVMQRASNIFDNEDQFTPLGVLNTAWANGVFDRFYNRDNTPLTGPVATEYITGWCEMDDELKENNNVR